jgi:Fe2+ transport system protein FeoA
VGQSARIREARDDSPERLRRWQTLGLTPGATVHILRHQPLDDLYEVQVGGRVVALGSEGLTGLLGEPLRGEPIPPATDLPTDPS